MKISKTISTLAVVLMAAAAKASVTEEETGSKGIITRSFGNGDFASLQALPTKSEEQESPAASSSSSSSLRGGSGVALRPIPPIHPVHTATVIYSSMMDPDGSRTYRRDINLPCDNGLLVFNVGPSSDALPYHWDVYADAYIWSDNGGLCILYPTYTAYQVSSHGPFWRPGYDPTTVKFTNLLPQLSAMHQISSRLVGPPEGAPQHTKEINPKKGGDYAIVTKGDFYDVGYYQRLKAFVNSWAPDGHRPHNDEFGWMDWDGILQNTEPVTETQ